MELENTPENKAKFFALYWGQKVAWFKIGIGKTGAFTVGSDNQYAALCKHVDYGFNNAYLSLTPLSQITDEDAEFVIGSIECKMKQTDINNGCYGMSPSGIFVDSLIGHNSFYLGYREVDYLRLKGYGVRWGNLSVEKQIEYGWVNINDLN